MRHHNLRKFVQQMCCLLTVCLVVCAATLQAEEKSAAPTTGVAPPPGMEKMPEGVIEQIIAGGWVSWTLVLVSVISLGLSIELYVITDRRKVIPDDVVDDIERALDAGEYEEAVQICDSEISPAAKVLGIGLARTAQGADRMMQSMTDEAGHQLTAINTRLGWLSMIASLAPTMGLLGTVLGMIESFGVIAKSTTTNPQMLAGGIYVALICTTMGLVVCIPGTVAFVFCRFRIQRLQAGLAMIADGLVERFHGQAQEG